MNTGKLCVNLEEGTDWNRADYFVNTFKSARKLGSPFTPWDGKALTDGMGWPVADFGAVVFFDRPGAAGVYNIEIQGQVAKCSPVAVPATVQTWGYDSTTGTTSGKVSVSPHRADRADLNLAFTGVTAPIIGVSIIKEGEDKTKTFTTEFLKALAPFGGIRCMDWTESNKSTQVTVADLPQIANSTWSYPGKGVPLAIQVQLANEASIDLWINIPYQATDAYIDTVVRFVSQFLAPGLKCYIEYSNEVWNWSFPQSQYNDNLAKLQNPPIAYYSRMVDMAARIGFIIKPLNDRRLLVVLATQGANVSLQGEQQKYAQKTYGGYRAAGISVYAIAPYFGNDAATMARDDLTPDQIAEFLYNSAGNPVSAAVTFARNVAKTEGLQFMAYECGVDLGSTKNSLQAKIDAQYLPRTGEAVSRYLARLLGPSGFDRVWYYQLTSTFTNNGYWGLSDSINNLSDDPKYLAAAKVAVTVPDWIPNASGPSPVPSSSGPLVADQRIIDLKLNIVSAAAQVGAAKVATLGNVNAQAALTAVEKQTTAAKSLIQQITG